MVVQLSPINELFRQLHVVIELSLQVFTEAIEVGAGQCRARADFKDTRLISILGSAVDLMGSAKGINVSSGLYGRTIHRVISKILRGYGKSYNTINSLWITSEARQRDALVGGMFAKYTIRRVA